MTDDLVKRLRDPVHNWNSGGRFEAVDRIESLEAEVERLRMAVIDLAENITDWGSVDPKTEYTIDIARAARPESKP